MSSLQAALWPISSAKPTSSTAPSAASTGTSALVEVGGKTISIPAPGKMTDVQKDGPCCLTVRPESIQLSAQEGQLPGRVSRATYYGAKVEYEVMLGEHPIIVEVYNPQLTERFAEGDEVYMTLINRCVRVLR